jgi:hypothetical protein
MKQATLKLNGKVSGVLKDLHIPYLEIEGVGNTSLAASGEIKGLPEAKTAFYDITLAHLKTTRTDLFRFIPEKSFPETLRLPENISVNGKFKGTIKQFIVQLHTATSKGTADVKGSLNIDKKTYDLTAATHSLDLGYILGSEPSWRHLPGKFLYKRSGFDPKR